MSKSHNSAPLIERSGELRFGTPGRGFTDITADLADWLISEGADRGQLSMLLRHTSASLVIQENADPDVLRDLGDAFERLAPEGAGYRHDAEGPDDMPAHIRSALTAASLTLPVRQGEMALGTWQAVYLAEHRTRPHQRKLALSFVGTEKS